MRIKMFQVDAFTGKLFGGNPAAVCPLKEWLPEETMQLIASENNLPETAFFVKKEEEFYIRWFTPTSEINLCGHATLASGHVLFNHLHYTEEQVVFHSKGGELRVRKTNDFYTLDFPTGGFIQVDPPDALTKGLGVRPLETYKGSKYLAVLPGEKEVLDIKPDLAMLAMLEAEGVIITAKGKTADFVSRFFAPRMGIDEDPVTGSSHTVLIPYWAKRLQKTELHALQLSERKGELFCKFMGERVEISGKAVTFFEGEIYL